MRPPILAVLAGLALALSSCSPATGTPASGAVDQPVGDQGTGVPKGVDISEAYYAASKGVTYKDLHGTAKAPLQIFADHGYTWARVRLMVTLPAANNNVGLVQDLAYVKSVALDIQAKGMKFLLDLHYSDDWADPSHQTIPASWSGSSTVTALAAQVKSYTQGVMEALVAQGTPPDMVQIGNETNAGMLWDLGKLTDGNYNQAGFASYATLEAAGAEGIKAGAGSAPVPKLMVHIAKTSAYTASWTVSWFKYLKAAGGVFDAIGLSYYPAFGHGSQTDLSGVIKALKADATLGSMSVWVVETAYYLTTNSEGFTGTTLLPYDQTPAGQLAFLKATRATVTAAGGAGVFYWGAAWVQPSSWLTTTGSTGGWYAPQNRALFNASGVAQVGIDF